MSTALQEARTAGPRRYRLVALAWLVGLAAHLTALQFASKPAVVWINNVAWLLASAGAAFSCFGTARRLEAPKSLAWWLFGIACTSWFIGQVRWSYGQLIDSEAMPVLTAGQLFYTSYPVLMIAGILRARDPQRQRPFTFKHLANVVLVVCCLLLVVVLGLLDPTVRSQTSGFAFWIGVVHFALVAATFLTALHVLWTYSWQEDWFSMMLLVTGMGIYAVSNLVYSHSVLAASYFPQDIINASWLIVFGFVAVAAAHRDWARAHPSRGVSARTMARERRVEAVVPALMLIIMVLVAVGRLLDPTATVGIWAATLFIVFAIVLGAREAWIQKEAQQLNSELLEINRQMIVANAELRSSEARYRELNMALEQRVAERTAQVKDTYDELEGFSYAVAHDLKAPLRAINSYAHLLHEELRPGLSRDSINYIARIRAGSLRMAALIDDLLAYSRADRRGLKNQNVALRALIDSIVSEHTDEIKRRNVVMVIDVAPVTLYLDTEGLSLALRNLIQNALKYTRDAAAPRIEIRSQRSDAGLTISVRDNGVGFDMQYHDKIFKVFQRLYREEEYPGTGIGLALVRKAIDRFGGRVWAQSAPGDGATFFIELPAGMLAPETRLDARSRRLG